jgi:RNA polymerase sigma-70 factor (ECF subfamily)
MDAMQVEDRKTLNPSRAFDQAETSRLLSLALTALRSDLREAVKLRDLEGMSYQQVAAMTGVPEGTVKSRLFRAHLCLARTFSHPASLTRRLRKPLSLSGSADPLPCG